MPEMNTPVVRVVGSGQRQHGRRSIVAAWRHVPPVVQHGARRAQSSCCGRRTRRAFRTPARNQLGDYFPGASQVDLVGASGYNFGTTGPLPWTDPGALFASAYTTIESLAAKPFWLAETGSTATGGDKAGWIQSLASLRATVDAEARRRRLVRRRRPERRLPHPRERRHQLRSGPC